jgi:hypothetical protein
VRDVAFCTPSFSTPKAVPYGEFTLACLLWALIGADTAYLLEHDAPALYKSGILWKQEEPLGRSACPGGDGGQELFLGVPEVLKQGFADCEDVACWRVSEVRLGRGEQRPRMRPTAGHPVPVVLPVPWNMFAPRGPAVLPAFFKREVMPGQWVYHIIVFWPDGTFEDPSRVLGMGMHYGYQVPGR